MAQTKQRRELVVLCGLVVVAALVWYFYAGHGSTTGPGGSGIGPYTQINAQDFGKIITGLEKTQSTEYKSAGRNIFVMGAIQEAKTEPEKVKEPYRNQGPMPPAPPPPADLPMIFFGYGMLPAGGARQAFLKEPNGDDVHIVSEGDLVLNHIKILHIGNDRIDFEDINTGQKGSKNLEAPQA